MDVMSEHEGCPSPDCSEEAIPERCRWFRLGRGTERDEKTEEEKKTAGDEHRPLG